MSKYNASTETIQSFLLGTAQPLDIKEWFEDLTDLQDITVDNNPLFFYEGMLAKVVSTGKIYRWMESSVGAIGGGYTYGTYEHDGVIYTGRTFNWVDVGNNIFVVPLAGSFPDVEATPIGSIAVNEFVDVDTFVGIFELQAGSPNVWVEIMRTSTSVTYAWIKAQIEADDNNIAIHSDNTGGLDIGSDDAGFTPLNYVPLSEAGISVNRLIRAIYEGSAGIYGTSKKFARGDHGHSFANVLVKGFLDSTVTLTNAEDLDDYKAYGIWYYIQSDLPTNAVDLTLAATEYYQLRISNMPNGDVVQEIWTREGGFQAKRNYDLGTTTWSAWDTTWHIKYADSAAVELGSAIDEFLTPSNLGPVKIESFSGNTIFTDNTNADLGDAITLVFDVACKQHYKRIGASFITDAYLKFTSSFSGVYNGFSIALADSLAIKVDMEGTMLGYDSVAGIYYQLRWKCTSNTPNKIEIYKLDGTTFAAGVSTYEFWFNHASSNPTW